MKKTLVLLIIGMIVFGFAAKDSMAARKSKKTVGVISAEDITSMGVTIDRLTKKLYSNSLFSPQDNAAMIEIKIKLDNQMLIAPDAGLAPLYYKAANLYKAREYKQESVDCYQTILENFPDTALAPKARQMLTSMGIAVVDPNAPEGGSTGQAADADGAEAGATSETSTATTDSTAQ